MFFQNAGNFTLFLKADSQRPVLSEHATEIYLLTLQEAMAHLNTTCRYQYPDEFMDVLPTKEFEVLPLEDNSFCWVSIRADISLTDALDSIFHEIKSDIGEPPKVMDCLIANCLVAAQAARAILGDEKLNLLADEMRGGRTRPIRIRQSPANCSLPFFFDTFGIPVDAHQPTLPGSKNEARFGYMLQPDPEAYSNKHDHLESRGFHHIALPNGSVLAFSPMTGGKFKDSKTLAKYMVSNMNQDLSSDEW